MLGLTGRSVDRPAAARAAVVVTRLFLLLGVGLVGCSGLEPVTPFYSPITDPTQLYTRLTLDYRALALSTDTSCHCNTWQVTATPRNAVGEAMAGLPLPTYTSLDTSSVLVTASGQLTALKAATNVKIIAELVAPGNLRQADTAFVTVTTSSPPVLASVSLDPLPPDSAIRSLAGRTVTSSSTLLSGEGPLNTAIPFVTSGRSLTPRALNTTEGTITGLSYTFESLDPTIATLNPAATRRTAGVKPLRPGQARFVARTTAYGVTAADTVVFTITMPVFADVVVQSSPGGAAVFQPSEVRIRSNGMVFWFNTVNAPVDVTFDDPTNIVAVFADLCTVLNNPDYELDPVPHCVPGSFTLRPVLPDSGGVSTLTVRQFPVPGVYTYRSTLTGTTGRVVVSDVGS